LAVAPNDVGLNVIAGARGEGLGMGVGTVVTHWLESKFLAKFPLKLGFLAQLPRGYTLVLNLLVHLRSEYWFTTYELLPVAHAYMNPRTHAPLREVIMEEYEFVVVQSLLY